VSRPNELQPDLFLHLLAISGEYPKHNLSAIMPSESYSAKVIAKLTKEGMIRRIYQNKMRAYRLTQAGKQYLLGNNPIRYEGILTGRAETNHPPSDPLRRRRLWQISETLVLMYNAGIDVFQDIKPDVFGWNNEDVPHPLADESGLSMQSGNLGDIPAASQGHSNNPAGKQSSLFISRPSFYTSREYKRGGGEMGVVVERIGTRDSKHLVRAMTEKPDVVRGSQGIGVLLTPTKVINVYNTSDALINWSPGVERKWQYEMQNTICRRLLSDQYRKAETESLLIGHSMCVLGQYLSEMTNQGRMGKFLTATCDPLYYITNDIKGIAQLRLLCDDHHMERINRMLAKGLQPKTIHYPMAHDALTDDRRPVIFLHLPNIPRLIRFKSGLEQYNKKGVVYGFDFHQEVLGGYLGESVEYKGLKFDKVIDWLLGPQG